MMTNLHPEVNGNADESSQVDDEDESFAEKAEHIGLQRRACREH